MGDADDSYDFGEIARVRRQAARRATTSCRAAGCRAGGGTVMPGAMPFLHRWWGNPMFSLRWPAAWFRAPIHDVYCGMRGFTKELYDRARPALHRDGVRDRDDHQGEPATARDIAEVPITLHPDGRKAHAPHLQDVPRRLAHAALLPALQPALAVPDAGRCC